jgi:ribosomal protein L21
MLRPCEGCLTVGRTDSYSVCMTCTVARHKAVLSKKCVCKKKDKRESHIKRTGSRQWTTCLRCLGTIRQIS